MLFKLNVSPQGDILVVHHSICRRHFFASSFVAIAILTTHTGVYCSHSHFGLMFFDKKSDFVMYLLVRWVNDNPKTWSVISINLLSDGRLRKGKNLVGRTAGVNWNKRVEQAVVLEAALDRASLELKADELADQEFTESTTKASPTSDNGRKRINQDSCSSLSNNVAGSSKNTNMPKKKAKIRIDEIQSVLKNLGSDNVTIENPEVAPLVTPIDVELEVQNQDSTEEGDLSGKLEALRTKYDDLKKKYRALKNAHNQCSNDESVELVEGSGVRLIRSEVDAIRTMSPSITFFARNLFRRVFEPEDILNHSLLGRKSTSIPNHAPLPSVDPQRRDAIIEFSLKTYGFEKSSLSNQKERKTSKTAIIKSLSDYVREENAKAKKLQPKDQ